MEARGRIAARVSGAPRLDRIVASRWSGLFCATLLALNLAVGALAWFAPTLTVPVFTDEIRPEAGHNNVATIRVQPSFPYVFGWDSSDHPSGADATVLEDGAPLGPAHSAHADVRSLGAGRFSLWNGDLYFSTSDNSDPRVNGRTYTVRVEMRLPRRLTLGCFAIDLVALFLFRRGILRWLLRNGAVVAGAVVVVVAGRIALTAAGGAPIVFDHSASAIDARMALGIVAHVVLGFALSGLILASGAGALIWAGQARHGAEDLLLRAFLPGTIVVAVAALIALAWPGAGIAALIACLITAAPIVRLRPDRITVRRVALSLAACSPIVALYAVVLSFRFHGPSATLAGAPMGDETIYVGWANMLTQHLVPLYNFGSEGARSSYGNLLPSLLMAPLVGMRGFDPYLFLCGSLPVLGLLPLCVTAPLLAARLRPTGEPTPAPFDIVIFAGLVAGAFRYPSALVESPPFAFLLPVIVSTLFLSVARPTGPNRPFQAFATAVLGTALSKVVAFVTLVPLAIPAAAQDLFRRASRWQRVTAAVVGSAVLGYAALALCIYLPTFSSVSSFGPNSWDAIVRRHLTDPFSIACIVARDLGALTLAAAVARSSWSGLKLGVWLGIALALTFPFLFHTSLTAAALLTAFAFWVEPRTFARARGLLVLAAGMLLPDTIAEEIGGPAVTLAWFGVVATMTGILALGSGAADLASPRASRIRSLVGVAAALVVLVAVLLGGAASGLVHVGPEDRLFTPDMRDIWLAVKQRTPRDALVFTDQTDDTESRLGGWDDFALAAQRQFYLASWAGSPLRTEPERRHAALARNAAVLSGRLKPSELDLTRHYDGFFAVLGIGRTPPMATLLYQNGSYALFRLAP